LKILVDDPSLFVADGPGGVHFQAADLGRENEGRRGCRV
jgi:hypothetical protein